MVFFFQASRNNRYEHIFTICFFSPSIQHFKTYMMHLIYLFRIYSKLDLNGCYSTLEHIYNNIHNNFFCRPF